jgi:deoxyribose-phosphate aldolase
VLGAARTRAPDAAAAVSGIARLIDHTLLKADATRTDVDRLCAEAQEFRFATVCVNGGWVRYARALLEGSGVAVCSVVGFPLGAMHPAVKRGEARQAISDGAGEVDMVIDIGALKGNEVAAVVADIEGVVSACREAGAASKIIIETALLTRREKVAACLLALRAGAAFVKTSTGFGPSGATVEDVALMRHVVGASVGVKAAGGIRDLDALLAMVAAGASRVGASAGVKIVREARARGIAEERFTTGRG